MSKPLKQFVVQQLIAGQWIETFRGTRMQCRRWYSEAERQHGLASAAFFKKHFRIVSASS